MFRPILAIAAFQLTESFQLSKRSRLVLAWDAEVANAAQVEFIAAATVCAGQTTEPASEDRNIDGYAVGLVMRYPAVHKVKAFDAARETAGRLISPGTQPE